VQQQGGWDGDGGESGSRGECELTVTAIEREGEWGLSNYCWLPPFLHSQDRHAEARLTPDEEEETLLCYITLVVVVVYSIGGRKKMMSITNDHVNKLLN